MAAPAKATRRASVHGLLLLNKPAGITSNRALQIVKRHLGAKKAGHTGSLDPAATGMLPLCFGEGTKVCAFLLDADKTYRVVARLGSATDTGDADGSVTETADVPTLDANAWQAVMDRFTGRIEQVPPMYSALKKDGKRLYELARQGKVVERAPRPVEVHWISLLEARGTRLVFRVQCSKGTYIRTLVEDVARAGGTVAHTANLHREQVGDFRASDMIAMSEVERLAGHDELGDALLPVDAALASLAAVTLPSAMVAPFLNGQRIEAAPAEPGLVRVYGPQGRYLGVAERDPAGRISPRRVFRLPE